MDYVNRGRTMMRKYKQNTNALSEGHSKTNTATESTIRVTVEEAPVEILAPTEPVFSYPNKIGAKDFDGWVQERGLYFMSQWDPQYKPLLSCHYPGEPPQNGGMLMTHYGKGVYISSGYAFSRQLPAEVPGAIRLFVNMVSAGHEAK